MKLIKKINNNYALAAEDNGEIVVVSGCGIGFGTVPRIVKDYSKIEKVYRGIDKRYLESLEEISQPILELSEKIIAYAKEKLNREFSRNFIVTLADHIDVMCQRLEQNLLFDFAAYYDFKYLYPEEVEVAKYAMDLIQKTLQITLPDSELGGLVMNIVSSELNSSENPRFDLSVIDKIVEIVEKTFSIQFNEDSFHYSRFITHVLILLRRLRNDTKKEDDNRLIYEDLVQKYPMSSNCVELISQYLKRNLGLQLDENEKLYLILHVNRLCS